MSIDVVYATGTDKVPLNSGAVVTVRKGTHWPATDPVVMQRPDLFAADPRYGLLYTEAPPGYDIQLEPAVEEATANPGERRNARRAH